MTTRDARILEQAGEYDAQALAEIYDRYAERIYRYLYRYLGDAAQAEDLTSEVFLTLLRVLNTSRAPRDRLEGWLYRVAHNQAMDWFRRQAKGEGTQMLADDLLAGEDSPATVLERQQTRQDLRAAIRQLTPEQQRVILLRFGEGFKCAEVAQLMGKSQGAIKVLQHRAVRRLRKLLDQGRRDE